MSSDRVIRSRCAAWLCAMLFAPVASAQALPACPEGPEPRPELGDDVYVQACVLVGERELLVGVVQQNDAWSVRVAIARGGEIRTRSQVSLASLLPGGTVSMDSAHLGIVRAGPLVRIGIGMAVGEDEFSATELAWLIDLDGDRVRSQWSGIGSVASDSFGQCSLEDMATMSVANGRVRLRFARARRFTPDPEWSRAERARRSAECRFVSPPRGSRSELLHPRLVDALAEWPLPE